MAKPSGKTLNKRDKHSAGTISEVPAESSSYDTASWSHENDESAGIGPRIAAARKQLGLTQPALSQATGIPVSMIKKYEGSHVRPGTQALASIVVLGVNANWLLVGQRPILLADLHPPGSLDPARLRTAIEVIEEGLAGKVMPPDQKAETVLAAYDLLESEGVTKERVIKLVVAGLK